MEKHTTSAGALFAVNRKLGYRGILKHAEHCYQSRVRREAWNKWFPHHCRKCGGFGSVSYAYDPSPPGVGLSAGFMIDTDPCGECFGGGTCPRCGCTQLLELYDRIVQSEPGLRTTHMEEGYRCPSCGWDDKLTTDTPPLHECNCWEDD